MNSQAASLLRKIDKKLGNINGQIRRLVDAIANGTVAPRGVTDRLAELEDEREEVERERAAIGADPLEFHPNAASAYRDKIRSLKRTLTEAGDESRQAVFQGLREIVEKIVIHPGGRYAPVNLEIFGQLAAILKISDAADGPSESKGALVAGARNNALCGSLPCALLPKISKVRHQRHPESRQRHLIGLEALLSAIASSRAAAR